MDGAVYIVSKLNLLAMDEEEASVNTSIAGMDLDGTCPAMATSS
jgi:hypothetical protein